MSIALPPVRRVPSAAPPDARWPRLVAHLDTQALEVAIERSGGGLSHVRRLAVPAPDGLAASLKAYLASTGQAAVAGAIVVDGSVTAGRFHSRAQPRGVGIESLRIELGLRALRVVDERAALCLSTRMPTFGDVCWVLAPRVAMWRGAVPTAICRLGSDTGTALLAPVGRSLPAPPPALMSHPFAPADADELVVVAAMRARGLPPVFGNLLSAEGLSRAFEALAGIDYDNACPLSAEGVVSLAARDARAQRACAVICAAIAQLCALLSFDGVRRVLLAGRAATLLAPMLARYPLAQRLQAVRAEAAEPPVAMELGVLSTPIRFLEGARASLDQAMQALSPDGATTLLDRVGERYGQLTPSSQRVADLALDNPSFFIAGSISALAAAAGVSVSQVSRFCRSLGLGGLVEFKRELVADQARAEVARPA